MKTLVKTEQLRAACRFVVAFACLGCLPIGPAGAQVRDKPAPPAAAKEAPPERVLQIFPLKYAKAEEMLQLVKALVQEAGTASVAVDQRTNSLVIRGTPALMKTVAELIAQFDRPEPSPPQRQLKVFTLMYADPESVTKLLAKLVESKEARLAADLRTRSIVLQAPPETARIVEALVLKLDTEVPGPAARPGAAYQVRIVWLASGLNPKAEALPAAKELDPVVKELKRLGIEEVRQVGQMQVNTAPDGQFQIGCSPLFDGAPVEFRADGKLDVKSGVAQMALRISAVPHAAASAGPTPPGAGGSGVAATPQLISIETMLSPRPDGSFVVLGIAPIGKVTSVFVVQVTEKRQP